MLKFCRDYSQVTYFLDYRKIVVKCINKFELTGSVCNKIGSAHPRIVCSNEIIPYASENEENFSTSISHRS